MNTNSKVLIPNKDCIFLLREKQNKIIEEYKKLTEKIICPLFPLWAFFQEEKSINKIIKCEILNFQLKDNLLYFPLKLYTENETLDLKILFGKILNDKKNPLNLIEEKIQIKSFPINLRVFKIAEYEEFNNLISIYNEKWFKLKP